MKQHKAQGCHKMCWRNYGRLHELWQYSKPGRPGLMIDLAAKLPVPS
jgi:hypothetical protein